MSSSNQRIGLAKAVLALFLGLVAALTMIGIADWRAHADPAISGSIGVPSLLRPDSAGGLVVAGLEPDGPLAHAGVLNGDSIRFDRPGTNYRDSFRTDERIGLTLTRDGRATHMVIAPARRSALDPRAEIAATIILWLPGLISLLVAAAIVYFKGSDGVLRAFAWSLLFNAPMTIIYDLPGGAVQDACAVLLRPIEQVGGYACLLYFALRYPDPQLLWRRRVVRVGFTIATVSMVAVSFTSYAVFNGIVRAPVATWTLSRITLSLFVLGMIIATLALLWRSWRRSTGSDRNRLGWLGLCLAVLMGGYMAGVSFGLAGLTPPAILKGTFSDAVSLLATAGLAYALLRHRVFDFGFALNRALVFTFTSGFLLIVFSVSEFAVDKWLHFESREKNVVFDAIVALTVILSFHRIQHWIGHKVDYLFFHAWHDAAARFDSAMDRAAHITVAAPLQAEFARALVEFCECGGMAIYTVGTGDDLVLTYTSLHGMANCLDANDAVAVSLRHGRRWLELSASGPGVVAEIAFPMVLRGVVAGAVMITPRQNGQAYRPDEVARIAASVDRLGMYLESLRVLELEQQAKLLQKQLAMHEQRLAVSEAMTAQLRQVLQLSQSAPPVDQLI